MSYDLREIEEEGRRKATRQVPPMAHLRQLIAGLPIAPEGPLNGLRYLS